MPTSVPSPPSERTMRRMLTVLEPLRRWVEPKLSGLENLADRRGCLIVGNHSLFGAYALLIATELYERASVTARGLVDRNTRRIPGWWNVLTAIGGVEGTRDNSAVRCCDVQVHRAARRAGRRDWARLGLVRRHDRNARDGCRGGRADQRAHLAQATRTVRRR